MDFSKETNFCLKIKHIELKYLVKALVGFQLEFKTPN